MKFSVFYFFLKKNESKEKKSLSFILSVNYCPFLNRCFWTPRRETILSTSWTHLLQYTGNFLAKMLCLSILLLRLRFYLSVLNFIFIFHELHMVDAG